MRADNVIVIDDDGIKGQVEVSAPEAPPPSIKVEHEKKSSRFRRTSPQEEHTDQGAGAAVLPYYKRSVS